MTLRCSVCFLLITPVGEPGGKIFGLQSKQWGQNIKTKNRIFLHAAQTKSESLSGDMAFVACTIIRDPYTWIFIIFQYMHKCTHDIRVIILINKLVKIYYRYWWYRISPVSYQLIFVCLYNVKTGFSYILIENSIF